MGGGWGGVGWGTVRAYYRDVCDSEASGGETCRPLVEHQVSLGPRAAVPLPVHVQLALL